MKIIRNLSWIFIANLVVSLTKWLIVVVIARALTPEDVGAYSLAFAISAPIILFANMKLRSLYITEDKLEFNDYISVRKVISIFSSIILVIIATFVYQEYFYVIILVSISKIYDLQSDIYYAVPHKEENLNLIGKLMIIKHLITLIVFILTMLFTKDLIISLFSQLMIQVLFFYFVEKKNIGQKYNLGRNKIIIKNLKKIIILGVPLGFVQMMVSFNTFYPRYLLEFFESTKILGYYSAIAYILVLGNLIMNAVAQTFLPMLSRKFKQKQYLSFRKNVFLHLSAFAFVSGIILIALSLLFGESFLRVVYGSEYIEYIDILILMVLALPLNFLNWNLDIALLAMKYISIQPKISFFMLLVNLIVGYFTINNYGIYGAAYTIIITSFIQLLLRAYFVNKKINYSIRQTFEN
ncbi:hypothetical protein DYI25_14505 [Mesobacillus boroniphilus]|uniref:Polysaccharide biosynthesis protein C-terminal domain-containing protein n=1 Tax=Mesobacillus boroniphilus TaxID=308892 RepID=A0A944CNH1_9BACI|nr:oligosaccharide flippase family protein [Mesobacillus boroniphilus]MBS8265636.1 hypothetical protein [Mesobacillus boroniphilus]